MGKVQRSKIIVVNLPIVVVIRLLYTVSAPNRRVIDEFMTNRFEGRHLQKERECRSLCGLEIRSNHSRGLTNALGPVDPWNRLEILPHYTKKVPFRGTS